MKPESVDAYLKIGCGRCALGGTPDCKALKWTDILIKLRQLVVSCGLSETVKWGVPCYTYKKTNVILLGAFKDNCFISFMKGALLNDPEKLLQKPGENTQADRIIRFTKHQEVLDMEHTLKAYIYEAIEVEKAGLTYEYKKIEEFVIPEELQAAFTTDQKFETAFKELTPGRQRGYILHFSQPKKTETRVSRIEKCRPSIFEGRGLNDR